MEKKWSWVKLKKSSKLEEQLESFSLCLFLDITLLLQTDSLPRFLAN